MTPGQRPRPVTGSPAGRGDFSPRVAPPARGPMGVFRGGRRGRALFESRRSPQPVFDVMGTMLLSRAVMAGARFGVFDRLARGPKTAPEAAAGAGWAPAG